MLSNNSVQPKAFLDVKAGAAEETVPLMSADDSVEGAAGGSGTINDPPGSDTKPPGYADLDLLA